ncbi:hypothetical protein L208DRAFT_1379239 [Tricholoma matsutake]|nr:hypothetical protein L208DRAFT_1379239 [Tricholoma matsutake 945]
MHPRFSDSARVRRLTEEEGGAVQEDLSSAIEHGDHESGGLVNPNKLAMSRALGAAFLNHQVEQLEKTVSNNGAASGNWRSRRQQGSPHNIHPQMTPNSKPTSPSPSGIVEGSRRDREFPALSGRPQGRERNGVRSFYSQDSPAHVNGRRRSSEEKEKDKFRGREKDADVVVVDASVLVHALYQVKKWCREGREEVIIIPLEALNTLDLLKKGTTPLAHRARAASRMLEAQVGTNLRIRVQQDDAFVLWDKIDFADVSEDLENEFNSKHASPAHSPEWVRRTISCARWEVEHADTPPASVSDATKEANQDSTPKSHTNGVKSVTSKPKVVLAVLSARTDLSPRFSNLKLSSSPHNTDVAIPEAPQVLTPVPLPAPSLPPVNKFEPRSAGVLVAQWAARAHINIFEVEPTWADDDDRERPRRARRGSVDSPGGIGGGKAHGHGHGHAGKGRGGGGSGGGGIGNGAMVERPPAVMAMMEIVAQPSKVVRVLARGEKLDPDP